MGEDPPGLFSNWVFVPEIERNQAQWLHDGKCRNIGIVMGRARNVTGPQFFTVHERGVEGISGTGNWPAGQNGLE